MPIVKFPSNKRYVNERFADLMDNEDRYLLLYGGRGSSKSVFTARKLIKRCIREKYFRCLLIRKVAETVKDSQYQTLKDVIFDLGLSDLFEFTLSPLEIRCKNGNKFLARGMDKPEKIKSVKDPSAAWYEEGNQLTEDDFLTATTTIRAPNADYIQEIITFNPEYKGDFNEFWLYKKFYANQPSGNFRDTTEIELDNGDKVKASITSHHSTYKDNKYVGKEFIATLERMRTEDPYYYKIYCLGEWGNKQTGGEFYKSFDLGRHVVPNPNRSGFPQLYRPILPILLTFDENVNPYLTCNVWQKVGQTLTQIDEICLSWPNNKLKSVCDEFERRYMSHGSGVVIYGDATSKKEDVKLEKEYNFYRLAAMHLKKYRPKIKVGSSNPFVVPRGQFINSILSSNFDDIVLKIGENCKNTVSDYSNLLEAPDGTKAKTMVKDPDTGVRYQKYGHCTDANDYLICEVFKNSFILYVKGDTKNDKQIIKKRVTSGTY